MRGPQNAGLLVGRKDLVNIAATFQSPYSGIGRDLKIAKETMIGMVAAVERYIKVDHTAEWKEWARQIDYLRDVLSNVSGVETGYIPKEITNHVPRLWVKWDEKAFNFSREDCFKALQDGDPSIVPLRTPMGVTIVPWMMGQVRKSWLANVCARCSSSPESLQIRGPSARTQNSRLDLVWTTQLMNGIPMKTD